MAVPSTLEDVSCAEPEETPATETSSFRLCGGETAALARLAAVVTARSAWVCAFSKPATNPLEYAPGSTSMLSPYLKFGCLSARTFHAALDAAVHTDARHTTPPQSLHGQLYFREHFYLLAHATPSFCSAQGNPLCLHVEWRDPARDAAAAADLRRWAEGETGVPLVDAAMKQLRATGWLHHLLRHVVACFLTRGQLWIHWHAGRDVFDQLLLDADAAVNAANWMWLSATCFFYTYHRVYSPAHFARKYDRSGKYVRAWLPALRTMPNEYIYEPWKAPLEVQRTAGCVIGRDYPSPMCDPEAAAEANMRCMDGIYRAAPDEWKALIPPVAAAEVAKERGIDIRPKSCRAAAFLPLRRPSAATGTAAESVSPARSVVADGQCSSEVTQAQRDEMKEGSDHDAASVRVGGAGKRGRGKAARRVSRVQHNVG